MGYPTYPCKSCDHTEWEWRKDWEKYECEICGNVEKAECVVRRDEPMTSNPHPPTEGEPQEPTWVFVGMTRMLGTSELPDCCRREAGHRRETFECPECAALWLGEDMDEPEAVQAPGNSDDWTGCSDDEVEERKGWQT